MEDNILDSLGLQLVDYFISYQDYLPFNIPKELKTESKGEVYLVNKKNNKYQVIKIIKENIFNSNHLKPKDEVFEIIKEQSFKDVSNDIHFLVIYLNNDNKNENSESPILDLVISTPENILEELLKKGFINITKIVKFESQVTEPENNDDEEEKVGSSASIRSNNWKKVNFQNRHYLSETLKKCSNSNLMITWIFFVLPIVALIVFSIVLSLNNDAWLTLNGSLQILLFGGNFHNLIFGAHQYWRWLLYPFASSTSQIDVIALIFSLWMFYRVGRFIEGFYGWWKSIIIWVGSVVLTGVLQSVVDTNNIMSGFWVFTWISLGAMVPIIWNYKLFKTPIMTRFLATILFMFLFWFFFNSNSVVTLLYWMIGFGSGLMFAGLVGYHNRKISLYIAFSPIAITGLVIFAVLLWFLNPYYAVDHSNLTLNTLLEYNKYGLMSKGTIRNIMNNYFHIPWFG